MTAIPKPKKTKKTGTVVPQLTEYDYHEIGEKIGESLEFGTEVEIVIFSHKRYKTFSGIVSGADSQRGILSLKTGNFETEKISINSIVDVK